MWKTKHRTDIKFQEFVKNNITCNRIVIEEGEIYNYELSQKYTNLYNAVQTM